MGKKEALDYAVEHFTKNYQEESIFLPKNGHPLPNRAEIIEIIQELKKIIFPESFG